MYIEYSKLQLFLFYDVMTVRVFALITLLVFSNFCTKAADKPESIVYAVQPTTYESMRHGEPSERIQQLAKNLNTKLVFYACPWARCLKAIEDGEADLIDDLYFTEERARVMHLITPAYNELELGFRFYSLSKHRNKVRKYSDLYDFVIGTIRGNVYFDRFDNDARLNKVETKHISQSVPLVYAERVDLIIAPPSLTPDILLDYDKQHRLVLQPLVHQERVKLHYAISRKSPWMAFIDEVTEATLTTEAE
jgi:hypothetical protein